MRPELSPKARALLVLTCLVFWERAGAAEWALDGALGQQFQYNDNIGLSSFRKEPVVGYFLSPKLHASRKSNILDTDIEGQGDIRRYDNTSWDCDNYAASLNNSFRAKRSVLGLSGGYAVSCSHSGQIMDTGLLVANSQSESYRFTPSWAWQWTSRDQLILDALYSKTSYNNIVSSPGSSPLSFSGNDTYTVNLKGSHKWSRRLTIDEKLYFSKVKYTGSNASVQNLFGFQLGANYTINHFWTVAAGAGPRWVDGSQQQQDGAFSNQQPSLFLGTAGNVNLSFDNRVAQFATGYSIAVNPSAIGQTLETQTIFCNYLYQLTPRLSLNFAGNFILGQTIGGQSADSLASQFKRSYFMASSGATFKLAKNWLIKGSYVYSWQDFQQDKSVQNINAGAAESNLVMFFLDYSWDGVRDSR